MTKHVVIRVEGDMVGQRLDGVLAAARPGLSRNQWQALISAGQVSVNDKQVKPGVRLAEGGLITLPHQESLTMPSANQFPLRDLPDIEVIYLDDDVIVINKPAGVSAHPSDGDNGTKSPATVADIFADKISYHDDEGRAGIVHRLDKDTSGVMILARTKPALEFLQQQFKAREVAKHYIALVWGTPKALQARIELPIGRHPKVHTRMAVLPEGRPAVSEYRVEKQFHDYSLLDVVLLSGRMHQIRVHMSYLGNPVVGDKVYGKRPRPEGLTRQFLHAKSLGLKLPNGSRQTFEAPLPAELLNFLGGLV